MAIEFKLPDLGEGIDEADVLSLLVKEGDTVTEEQALFEVETDKATLEVPAPAAGTITSLKIKEGDTITPGQLVAIIEPQAGGESPAEEPAAEEQPAPPDEPPSEDEKAAPKAEEPAEEEPEPEPEPARAEAGEEETPEPEPETAREEEPAARGDDGDGRIPVAAAPSVRKLAREIGVDVRDVPGSGDGGRISVEDVKAYARNKENGARAGGRVARPQSEPLPDFSRFGEVVREPMTRVRRLTAENLANSWATIPHVFIFEKADVSALEEFRKRYRDSVERAGGRLTFTAILLKIVAAALKSHPKLNASIDMNSHEIVYKDYIHLGIAADTERGLLVPVIRDVDRKNIVELSTELADLAEKARSGKLPPDKMQGASFTISNLGPLRTGHFTPIINPPEVAILGVGRMEEEPVYVNGNLEPRKMLALCLSFDHRLVDGADGARFMSWLIDAINEPLLLALES